MALDLASLRTPFVIVGGVATALYMPQRLTLDVDILVLPTDASAMGDELRNAGFELSRPLAFGGNSWRTPDGSILDVLETDAPWGADAIRQPVRAPSGLPVIALPFLVLMKLGASRLQDLADVSRMLGSADATSLELVRAAVQAYRPEEREDLESLIALGSLEYDEAP